MCVAFQPGTRGAAVGKRRSDRTARGLAFRGAGQNHQLERRAEELPLGLGKRKSCLSPRTQAVRQNRGGSHQIPKLRCRSRPQDQVDARSGSAEGQRRSHGQALAKPARTAIAHAQGEIQSIGQGQRRRQGITPKRVRSHARKGRRIAEGAASGPILMI